MVAGGEETLGRTEEFRLSLGRGGSMGRCLEALGRRGMRLQVLLYAIIY
jgi:hypothetical protein